ncbi:hypothetical protein SAMN04487820_102119 [Actinopolyspora mzabensis]|uniref:Uncharacterized protein n=1 Tax=Actinopolyspora mzabensis TaxID=995066 RepID=A0A1G8WLU4_ACTMZ|nr:hypothetical protein [Actinopolyspora mzabensis]SDJ79319.1 hypothetical protein SAMN04487820_102119 [Actinopolyspora mzabensis]
MITVVDHREPSEHSPQHPPERTDGTNDAEPIDAEVVDEHPPERAPARPNETFGATEAFGARGAGDAARTERETGTAETTRSDEEDAHREYQQFLEFQRFREMRRQYGDTPPVSEPTAAGSGKRPWYRRALRLLRFKFVRRLLYLLVLLLVLMYLYNSMFGGGGGGGSNGSAPGGEESRSAMLQRSPTAAVRAVYDELANRPDTVCLLFDEDARSGFAAVHDAENCGAAARRLNERVAERLEYKNPDIDRNAVREFESETGGSWARISSCDLGVSGGPRLGIFRLRQESSGGWLIDGYEGAKCGE